MEELVRPCLYNWLGYGNLNGRVWFIGTEEGGAEIFRQKTRNLEQSLLIRKEFNLSMDFKKVWEEYYDIPLSSFKGPTVWRYMAAFILGLDNIDFTPEDISRYIFIEKKLGSKNCNHFMCELLPLPKKAKHDIYPYENIWVNIKDYHNEVIPNRFELIKQTINANGNIKLIICYEKLLTELILDYFKNKIPQIDFFKYNSEEYRFYELNLDKSRIVYFLSTPFFGNGRISYNGIKYIVDKINEYL